MRLDRRTALLGGLGLAAGAAAQTPLPVPAEGARALVHPDPTEFIDLWPDGAPGAPSPHARRSGARAQHRPGV